MIGTGMHAASGQSLDGIDHIRQSIAQILTTPIGSRCMRRDFGSLLPELIDVPITPASRLQVMAATATAVIKWEPRIRPSGVSIAMDTGIESAARLVVQLTGTMRNGPLSGRSVSVQIPIGAG